MMPRTLAGGLLVAAAVSAYAQAPREVHGSGDAYAEPDVGLAWAVLRGSSEAATMVIMRIAVDAAKYPWLAVAGVDPFTKAEQPLQPATQTVRTIDVRVPRSRYAELPRTEIRLFGSAAAAQAGAPQLTIFYLGIPDTTPEFADAAKLDAYLADRIARARAGAAKEKP